MSDESGNKPPRSETCDQLTEAQANAIATSAVQNVCELPDYNSPDDQPELLQCTVTELHHCVMSAIEANTQKVSETDEQPPGRMQQISHCECKGCQEVRERERRSQKACEQPNVNRGSHKAAEISQPENATPPPARCPVCGTTDGHHGFGCPV